MTRFPTLAALALALLAIPAAAVELGTVEGRFVVNGQQVALKHAYAAAESSAQGDQRFVRVVLSDQPISEQDLAAFPDSVLPQINAGKLHALRFLIVDEKGTLDATDVFLSAGMPTIKDASRLELQSATEQALSGRLHLTAPQKFGDWSLSLDYDLRFAAAIRASGE